MAGGKSVYPPNRTIHTFHVMDQLIEWFGNTKNFPNMKEIVVAGHSMGGQLVHRYAIVGKQLAVTGQ
jgi:triacylglycerol esterase/lipase EstA (alpha/beta hydrolase family)